MKKIFVSIYNEVPQESLLNYEQELIECRWMVEIIKKQYSYMTDDGAYLLFRNSMSSINTYTIREVIE